MNVRTTAVRSGHDGCAQPSGSLRAMAALRSTLRGPAPLRLCHGIEIAVDAQQQIRSVISRSSFCRQDSSRRSRSSATAMTASCVAHPFGVSEIACVRPSRWSALIVTSPRFFHHRQGPADRAFVEADDVTDARSGNVGSIASRDRIRHSVTLTPKRF